MDTWSPVVTWAFPPPKFKIPRITLSPVRSSTSDGRGSSDHQPHESPPDVMLLSHTQGGSEHLENLTNDPEKNLLHCLFLHKVVAVDSHSSHHQWKWSGTGTSCLPGRRDRAHPSRKPGWGKRTDFDLAKLQLFHLHWLEESWWVKTTLSEPTARTAG